MLYLSLSDLLLNMIICGSLTSFLSVLAASSVNFGNNNHIYCLVRLGGLDEIKINEGFSTKPKHSKHSIKLSILLLSLIQVDQMFRSLPFKKWFIAFKLA